MFLKKYLFWFSYLLINKIKKYSLYNFFLYNFYIIFIIKQYFLFFLKFKKPIFFFKITFFFLNKIISLIKYNSKNNIFFNFSFIQKEKNIILKNSFKQKLFKKVNQKDLLFLKKEAFFNKLIKKVYSFGYFFFFWLKII